MSKKQSPATSNKPTSQQWELYQTQVANYAQFSGTMTAVTLFFTGLILTNFENFDTSIRVPIGLLIISMFGFLYGTLLYSNASEEVSSYNYPGLRKAIYLGDIISEYLGLYLLVLSIPLVLNVVTTDGFLRAVALVSALGGLTIYQLSGFSIVERHFGQKHLGVAAITVFFGILLSLTQLTDVYFVPVASLFLLSIALVCLLATRRIPRTDN